MTLYLGDSAQILQSLHDNTVDAIVTDPPAGITLLGNEWDNPLHLTAESSGGGYSRNPLCRACNKYKRGWRNRPGCVCEKPDFDSLDRQTFMRDNFVNGLTKIFAECLRITKPGGYALVWSLPKTSHWTAKALEAANWQLVGSVAHVFAQGMPKSFNIAAGIEKLYNKQDKQIKIPDTKQSEKEDVQRWQGWGTALKPAYERWLLARKPGNVKPERRPPPYIFCAKTSKAEKQGRVANNHPTVKSIKLMTALIRSIADPGDTIVDPFAGSGSTLVACAQNGFLGIGIEKERSYFEIASSRLQEYEIDITMD